MCQVMDEYHELLNFGGVQRSPFNKHPEVDDYNNAIVHEKLLRTGAHIRNMNLMLEVDFTGLNPVINLPLLFEFWLERLQSGFEQQRRKGGGVKLSLTLSPRLFQLVQQMP